MIAKGLFDFGDPDFLADLNMGKDLSLLIQDGTDQVNCFYAPFFKVDPVRMGTFIGSVAEGGPVNFYNTNYNVHGHGTHTECIGHLTKEKVSIQNVLKNFWFPVHVCSVYPTKRENGDLVIEDSTLRSILQDEKMEALAIRTLPNPNTKKTRKYSGQNPCYFSAEAMEFVVSLGVKHLLVDLPSVDREEDGGKLLAHRVFWKEKRQSECTITELIYIPDELKDGNYLLYLQLAPFDLDAAPSRPIIYPLVSRMK